MPASANELDFWANDINPGILSPLMILRAQEPALRKRTGGIVEAKVISQIASDVTKHQLILIAPAVDNYQETILAAQHNVRRVYPCQVESASFQEYEESVRGRLPPLAAMDTVQIAGTQAEFIRLLKLALNSKTVRTTIDALLAKSNELEAGINVDKSEPHAAEVSNS